MADTSESPAEQDSAEADGSDGELHASPASPASAASAADQAGPQHGV